MEYKSPEESSYEQKYNAYKQKYMENKSIGKSILPEDNLYKKAYSDAKKNYLNLKHGGCSINNDLQYGNNPDVLDAIKLNQKRENRLDTQIVQIMEQNKELASKLLDNTLFDNDNHCFINHKTFIDNVDQREEFIYSDFNEIITNINLMDKSILSRIYTECIKIAKNNMVTRKADVPILDLYESIAIAMYTYDLSMAGVVNQKNFYWIVNNFIHNMKSYEDLDLALKSYMYYLIKGAKKLISPSIDMVYRGILTSDSIIKSYTPQKKVLWKPFTSTSADINVSKKFINGNGILFELKVANGCYVYDYSSIKNEKEILLLPGTEFLILSKSNDNGCKKISMIEMK
jgi:NAD:arginine ADP-ribosyltransferase